MNLDDHWEAGLVVAERYGVEKWLCMNMETGHLAFGGYPQDLHTIDSIMSATAELPHPPEDPNL